MNAQVHAVAPQPANIHADTSPPAATPKARAIEFLEQRLNYFQNNADDFLFELAGKTHDEDLNYLYLDIISRLRNKRDALKKVFFANFEKFYQDAMLPQSAMGIAFTADSAAIDKLLLCGNDDLEAMIAIKNIAEKSQRQYADKLSALHAAIPPHQHQGLAAVSPVLLCIAWKQAVDTLKLPVKAKFVVYKLFAKFVLDDLTTLYHGLLVEMGGQSPAEASGVVTTAKNHPAESSAPPTTKIVHATDAPIENKLHGRKLPEAVHQFLFTVWSEVLVQVKTQKGTDSPAWAGAMQVIDDLAAVTQHKQTPQNSARLLEIIPRLLCNLQNGLSLISYEKQKKEQLFNQLLMLHAHALQNRTARTA